MKTIVQFLKKIFNFFKMYNRNLRQRTNQFKQTLDIGKGILKQVVVEFKKLDAPPNSICELVDNDEKLLIKFLGAWVLLGIKVSKNGGVLMMYTANRWSVNWEDYKTPFNDEICFDNLGNITIGTETLMNPELYGYDVLEYVVKIGVQ